MFRAYHGIPSIAMITGLALRLYVHAKAHKGFFPH